MLLVDIDILEKKLLDIRKKVEKQIIHYFVACHSQTVSQTQKKMVEDLEEKAISEVKKAAKEFQQNFSDSAEGKWVDKAIEAIDETKELFNEFD